MKYFQYPQTQVDNTRKIWSGHFGIHVPLPQVRMVSFVVFYFKFSRQSFSYRTILRFEVFMIIYETYLNTSFSNEKIFFLEMKSKNCSDRFNCKNSLQMRHGKLHHLIKHVSPFRDLLGTF